MDEQHQHGIQFMKVIFATSEAVPFSKTGGLADVAGSLPKSLKKLGVDVSIVIPYHRMSVELQKDVADTGKAVTIRVREEEKKAYIHRIITREGIPVYLVKNDDYYDRTGLYGWHGGKDYPDNAERFIFFSRAVLELCRIMDLRPDIVHCHDWQTALIPVYLKTLYRDDPFFKDTASVYTIHNMGYQGLFWYLDMPMTGLGWRYFTPDELEFYGKINLMKGGILYADIITTVSKTYSREIQTEELGCGLEGVLEKRKDDIVGIVNGIDYDEWDPSADPYIDSNYSICNMSGKRKCKSELQRIFSLPIRKNIPVLSMITRLVDQKGLDIIVDGMNELMERDIQLVVLGTGNPVYEKFFRDTGLRYPKKAGIRIDYDNALAHKIEAGADIFLMPSRYEPCGLNQLYSLRYGTVPVVRATGGLNDTIRNYNINKRTGNGIKFRSYSKESLLKAVNKTLEMYKHKDVWNAVINNAMSEDFSSDHTASEYLSIYEGALRKLRTPKKTTRGYK